eukprot:3426510-Rhodomonas_salina.1
MLTGGGAQGVVMGVPICYRSVEVQHTQRQRQTETDRQADTAGEEESQRGARGGLCHAGPSTVRGTVAYGMVSMLDLQVPPARI